MRWAGAWNCVSCVRTDGVQRRRDRYLYPRDRSARPECPARYAAGKRLGSSAAAHLDRIPDADLRLFAQIELAAALAGLPELQGTLREQRARARNRA